jgi:hypothetical protein
MKTENEKRIRDLNRADLTAELNATTGSYTGDAATVAIETLRGRLLNANGIWDD